MRSTVPLTKSAPVQTVSLTWRASTCLVNNPTGSDILFRQGGSDMPTRDSASMVIPANAIYQFPAVGGTFAFGFDTPAAVGSTLYPIGVAEITLLDASEYVGSIGSIQVQAKPQFFDRSPVEVIEQSTLAIVAPFAITTMWTFTVPVAQYLQLESAMLLAVREVTATALNQAAGAITINGINIAEVSVWDNTIGFRDRDRVTNVTLIPGDVVTAFGFDSSTGGEVVFTASLIGYLFAAS